MYNAIIGSFLFTLKRFIKHFQIHNFFICLKTVANVMDQVMSRNLARRPPTGNAYVRNINNNRSLFRNDLKSQALFCFIFAISCMEIYHCVIHFTLADSSILKSSPSQSNLERSFSHFIYDCTISLPWCISVYTLVYFCLYPRVSVSTFVCLCLRFVISLRLPLSSWSPLVHHWSSL